MSVRNTNGSGSIKKMKAGTYKAELYYTDQYGKRHKMSKTEPTEAKAQKTLEKFRRDLKRIKKAETQDVNKYSVEKYFREVYLPYKKATLHKPQSYRRIESTVETHIIPSHGMKIITNLNSSDINSLISSMERNGMSHSSIKKVYDVYNNMYKYAIDVRKDFSPEDNPMPAVHMPSIKNFSPKEIMWLQEDEITLFAEEASRIFATGMPVYKYGKAFLFMLNTGIREGEMCALTKEDIDFDQNIIKVTKSVYTEVNKADNGENRYTLTVGAPKTRNSVRYVPMSEEAAMFAHSIIDEFPKGELFIHNAQGQIVRPDTLAKQFKSILENAGLEHRGVHTLRHTFVSVLFENNVDTHTIAEIIGDTEDTVKRTYLHLYKSRKAKAVSGINIVEKYRKIS